MNTLYFNHKSNFEMFVLNLRKEKGNSIYAIKNGVHLVIGQLISVSVF